MSTLFNQKSISSALRLWINLLRQLLVFCTLGLIALSAMAEKADRDKPIEIEADTVTSNDAKKVSVYTGNVIVTKGTLIIKGDKMVMREDEMGFQHGSSYGNPTTFKQKRDGKDEYIEGGAMRIEYDGRMDKVQLFTKAWVKRGQDIVHGDYIMYDATAEYSEVIP